MNINQLASLTTAFALISGCAATIDQAGLEQRTAQAIGHPTNQIKITERTEETGGRINYNVNTTDGRNYHCYMYSATAFHKAISFGQFPNSDAICTAISNANSNKKQLNGPCNSLLQAAGRC